MAEHALREQPTLCNKCKRHKREMGYNECLNCREMRKRSKKVSSHNRELRRSAMNLFGIPSGVKE